MATSLKVKAKKNGYRRAGRGFSDTEDTLISLSDLTKEQIAQLKGDKNLLVSEVEVQEIAPAIAAYATDKGVDLATVTGTGKGGAITKADIDAAAAPKK